MTGATDRAAQLHERAGARIHAVGGNVGGTRSRIPFLRYDLPMHTIVKREIARGPLRLGALCTLLLAGALAINAALPAAESATVIPAPAVDEPTSGATTATAVLAGGYFWGVQGVFQHVKGVIQATSGYADGTADTATYGEVGMGRSGHAESVQVTYDPRQISYGSLLQIYFSVAHDPTQLNRQGPDQGTQYRSAVFPRDPMQQKIAEAYIAQLDRAAVFDAPIATRIEMDKRFYPAEAYHQDFLALNPSDGYIVVNDLPKIDHLRSLFPQRYREQPVLVAAQAH
jgi:peptide-methionine (S)-S-oxide reductase